MSDERRRDGETADPTRTSAELPDPQEELGRIGPYRLLQRIGRGGMGEVYLAEQREPIHRRVAVKLIKLGMDTREVIARFETERQTLALMDHPGIAKVLDAGATEDGRPYFVMEHVPGTSIARYCDEQRLDTAERLELFLDVCSAVQHAHQKGIIHRDLKPSNILVAVRDKRPAPKIIDFGVAKAMQQRLTEKTLFTRLGQMIGTPDYMSPEQADPTALDVDTRTDVYSLGVVLYELLVGAPPFARSETDRVAYEEVRRRILEDDPPQPSVRVSTLGDTATDAARLRGTSAALLQRQLRGDLDWIVMKALEKDRARRYDTVSDLAADIRRHIRNEPVVAGPPGITYRVGKFVRRHRLGVSLATVALLTIVAFAARERAQSRTIAAERDRANQEARAAAQVSEFLVGLFSAASPLESRGADVTARELLERGADRIDVDLEDEPALQARLLSEIGAVYGSLALSSEAEPLLRRALELHRRHLPADDPATATCLRRLGQVLQNQGALEEAGALYLEAQGIVERSLGMQTRPGAEVANDLGVVAVHEGRLDDGESWLRRALEYDEHVDDGAVEQSVTYVNNLATVYAFRGRFEEAAELLQGAVDEARRELGSDHPSALLVISNLGAILGELERFVEAEPYYREALEARRRVFGDDHTETLHTLSNFAWLLEQKGDERRAESTYLDAIERWTRAAGENNEQRLQTVANLGAMYTEQGRLDEAIALLADAAARARRELPERNRVRATVLMRHGSCLARLERLAEAERELLDSYRVVEATQGADSRTAQTIVAELIAIFEKTGREEDAATWRERVATTDG